MLFIVLVSFNKMIIDGFEIVCCFELFFILDMFRKVVMLIVLCFILSFKKLVI